MINKIYNPIKSEFSVQSVSTNINVIGKTDVSTSFNFAVNSFKSSPLEILYYTVSILTISQRSMYFLSIHTLPLNDDLEQNPICHPPYN